MALPLMMLAGIGKSILNFIKPYIAPLLAYWKGKREGRAQAKAEANEHFIQVAEKAARDRDDAVSKRLRGKSDDDAHFRD